MIERARVRKSAKSQRRIKYAIVLFYIVFFSTGFHVFAANPEAANQVGNVRDAADKLTTAISNITIVEALITAVSAGGLFKFLDMLLNWEDKRINSVFKIMEAVKAESKDAIADNEKACNEEIQRVRADANKQVRMIQEYHAQELQRIDGHINELKTTISDLKVEKVSLQDIIFQLERGISKLGLTRQQVLDAADPTEL